jgi:hypothetical protein
MEKADIVKVLTGFDKTKEVALPMAKAKIVLKVPQAVEFLAARDFISKNPSDDAKVAGYVLKNYCITPPMGDFTDQEMADVVAHMHYNDLTVIILAFVDAEHNAVMAEMSSEEARDLFHRMTPDRA